MHARLRVSRGALLSNYRLLASQAASVAGVVKADAYGLGAEPVTEALLGAGCETLFVATVPEGVQLRQRFAGPTIYIFNGVAADDAAACRAAKLQPVLNSPEQVACWRSVAGTDGPCAVHVDTGMARLGFPWNGVDAALFNDLPVSLLLTHFACADEPGHPLNALQLERFETARKRLPDWPVSVGNSAATLAASIPTAGLVRAGLALYGGNPFSDLPNPLAPVASLEAPVLQVRTLEVGEPAGYGARWRAERPTRLAVLGIGYADGVPRSLSANGVVWLGGKRCPVVGRVSMDLVQVDVTEATVQAGDWAELFGANLSLDEFAAAQGTIAYEALTRINPRVTRKFEG